MAVTVSGESEGEAASPGDFGDLGALSNVVKRVVKDDAGSGGRGDRYATARGVIGST
jgi:hypothetical protein